MADPTIAEKRAVRTAEFVIVQSRYDWYTGVAAGVQDGRRHQGKGVVDVDDIWARTRPVTRDRTPGTFAPQDAGRQCSTPQRRPRGDFLAVSLKQRDLVAARQKSRGFLVNHGVLTAGRRRSITVVYDQDLYRRSSRIGAASNDAATISSSK